MDATDNRTSSMQTRRAEADDIARVAPLFDAYRSFYGQPPDLARADAFLRERHARGESALLLAERDGDVLGLAHLYPLFSSVRTARIWLLNDLFVNASARRRGVAAALLRAAAVQARALGAASLSLSTALDNAPAQALYESLGWQRDSQFCEYGLTL